MKFLVASLILAMPILGAGEVKPESSNTVVAQRPTGERTAPKHLRLSTDEEKAHWEKAVDSLWATPLGQLYEEYLFSPTPDHADLPLWARLLVKRMFQEPNLLAVRLIALQIMFEDLYVREKLNDDVLRRAAILGQHIEEKEALVDQARRYKKGFLSGTLIAASVPFGSRAFRQESRKLMRMALRGLRGQATHPSRRPRLKRVVNNFSAAYDPLMSVTTLGVFSLATDGWTYLYNDWLYGSKFAPKDQAMLAGMDALVRAMEEPGNLPLPARLPQTHR